MPPEPAWTSPVPLGRHRARYVVVMLATALAFFASLVLFGEVRWWIWAGWFGGAWYGWAAVRWHRGDHPMPGNNIADTQSPEQSGGGSATPPRAPSLRAPKGGAPWGA